MNIFVHDIFFFFDFSGGMLAGGVVIRVSSSYRFLQEACGIGHNERPIVAPDETRLLHFFQHAAEVFRGDHQKLSKLLIGERHGETVRRDGSWRPHFTDHVYKKAREALSRCHAAHGLDLFHLVEDLLAKQLMNVPGELPVLFYVIQKGLFGDLAQQGGDHGDDREVIGSVKQYGRSSYQPVAMAKTDDHFVAFRRDPDYLH